MKNRRKVASNKGKQNFVFGSQIHFFSAILCAFKAEYRTFYAVEDAALKDLSNNPQNVSVSWKLT